MFRSRFVLPLAGLVLATMTMSSAASGSPAASTVMPVPHAMVRAEGRLPVAADWTIAITGHDDARLRGGLSRALRRLEERTGLTFARTARAEYVVSSEPTGARLVISCARPAPEIPVLGQDESYGIEISPTQVVLSAPTVHGVLHGLETLLQCLESTPDGWHFPAVRIQDRPRYAWRGLMIDVCRHWQPMEVIKRNLDGMALVKLNVLHLHLTEDQGFRIESKRFPRLHELGSDGLYFTQDEMREIIAYAAERCIRVVPEFDIPGHATSWLVGYPELGSAPGPYVIECRWGIFDPVLDPTNPRVYEVLDGFLTEMAALFPDAHIHIGGDENNGVHWNANAGIQQYIRDHGLGDNHGLHAHFNNRVREILARNNRRLVGWDEILHPDLARDSVVHSWRGPQGIADATALGFATILSNGYYIDLMHPASDHYVNDPIPPGTTLTAEQQQLVLGGEATMWAEWVTPETIDSRIWPRTAAIAERLWARQDVRDVDDMYRRLGHVSRRLEEAGLRHESYLDPALRRLAGDSATREELGMLRRFVELLEPVKVYQRGQHQPDATQFTPLTGLVDCTRADSPSRRLLGRLAGELMGQPGSAGGGDEVDATLAYWSELARTLRSGLLARSPRLREAEALAVKLETACALGRDAAGYLARNEKPPAGWAANASTALDAAARPQAAVEFPCMPAIRSLVDAAARL